MELNPSGIATWLITLFIACSSFYAVRLLLPHLNDTWEEANTSTHSPGIIEKYNKGEIGHNELLHYSGLLINEFDEICNLIFKSVEEILTEKDLLTQNIKNYLLELKKFTFMIKKDLLTDTTSTKTAEFKYDFEAIQNLILFLRRTLSILFLNKLE